MTITILTKKPGEGPVEASIDNGDYDGMRKLVGGFYEAVRISDDIFLWCNEDGKRDGLAANLLVPGDTIVGDIFFTGGADAFGDTLGLTREALHTCASFCMLHDARGAFSLVVGTPPTVTDPPRHKEWLDIACPQCGTKPIEGVETDVDDTRLVGHVGIGLFAYCPVCDWRSTMMTRATL